MYNWLQLLAPMHHLPFPLYTRVIGRVIHMYKYDMCEYIYVKIYKYICMYNLYHLLAPMHHLLSPLYTRVIGPVIRFKRVHQTRRVCCIVLQCAWLRYRYTKHAPVYVRDPPHL